MSNVEQIHQSTKITVRSWHIRAKILLLLFGFGISLLVGELILRMSGRFPPPPKSISCSRPELYQQYDPYGYRLWPSRTTTYLYPKKNPRRLTVTSNKAGFRSQREFDEPDERSRILVVGDSFVFGEGVEQSERFTNVLETMEPRWRVDNLGMTGYGPDLMLRALEKVGLDANPDTVVFCMYTDDFRRVRPHYAGGGFEIPRYQLNHGRLETASYPTSTWFGRLHSVQAVRRAYWKYTTAEWDLNRAILDQYVKLADLHSFMPMLVFLPNYEEYPIDTKRRTWLAEYAKRNEVPFLDLSEPILSAGREKAFIPNNWHLNPAGHEIVATELRGFLAKLNPPMELSQHQQFAPRP